MVFTKDGLLRLIITIAISILICISASFIFFDELIAFDISKSALLGSVIWFVSEICFEIVEKIWPHSIIPGYIIMCIIIVFGTTGGLILYGIKSLGIILPINVISVLCGISIAIVNRKIYKNRLNKHLEEFKNN